MSREEIDARHPALLSTLANHPGIGFVLVRSEEHGGVVLGAHGAEVPIGELSDEHPGPLADFGPGAADAVRRTHGFPRTADIMVNSWYDPDEGEVLAFEEQIGSHGGLGGCQSRPFLMSPLASRSRWRRTGNWSAPNTSTAYCADGSARPTAPRSPWPNRSTPKGRGEPRDRPRTRPHPPGNRTRRTPRHPEQSAAASTRPAHTVRRQPRTPAHPARTPHWSPRLAGSRDRHTLPLDLLRGPTTSRRALPSW